jgi:DNA-binding NarL/FixJ family response regulator
MTIPRKPEPASLPTPAFDALRVERFGLLGEEYAVFSFAVDSEADAGERLTDAERGVLALLLAGDSNSTIAARRGTSVRTVANQVASIFKKLGICSRGELHSRSVRVARGAPAAKVAGPG